MMIFYSDNTLLRRYLGVLVINKQSENDHFKVLCVISEVMSGNLQNIEVKQLKKDQFEHLSTPKFDMRVHF